MVWLRIMDYDKTKKVFIFADESGDPGDPLLHTDSTDTFTITLCVATSEGVRNLEVAVSGFKFFHNYKKELKNLRKGGLKNLAGIVNHLSDVVFYEIVINKRQYCGPYLRDVGKYHRNPRVFRNFILRVALEYVVSAEDLLLFQKPIELVIDRYLDSLEMENNLKEYLMHPHRVNLPKFSHIEQVDSEYCPAIQMLDVVQKMKEIESVFVKSIAVPSNLYGK